MTVFVCVCACVYVDVCGYICTFVCAYMNMYFSSFFLSFSPLILIIPTNLSLCTLLLLGAISVYCSLCFQCPPQYPVPLYGGVKTKAKDLIKSQQV